jgi:hypothetical protein
MICGRGCAMLDGPTRYLVWAGNRAPRWTGYDASYPNGSSTGVAGSEGSTRSNHFTWEGIHFVYQRRPSGHGMPLILTHGWPSSFLDYMDILPMLEHFDVVVPSLPRACGDGNGAAMPLLASGRSIARKSS